MYPNVSYYETDHTDTTGQHDGNDHTTGQYEHHPGKMYLSGFTIG